MQALNLPKYLFNIKIEDDKKLIFDEIRKRFLVLTPEEWVRQNFIKYLNSELEYPKSLMNIEGGLKLNGNKFRADLLIYNRRAEPLILIEFKAPDVNITQSTFDQISRYNTIYKVPYLIVSNGITHYFCIINFKQGVFTFLPEIPNYKTISE